MKTYTFRSLNRRILSCLMICVLSCMCITMYSALFAEPAYASVSGGGIKQIEYSELIVAVIKADNSLWVWGKGLPGNTTSSVPKKIAENVKDVSLGCANVYLPVIGFVKTDGTLWMCGYNVYGQIGNNDTAYVNNPIQIMTNVKDVDLGDRYSAAITNNGSLYMWGNNANGQLGLDGNEFLTPVKVMDNVRAVTCDSGSRYKITLAITTDNKLWQWGNNNTNRVVKLDNVRMADSDNGTIIAVKNDNSLWTWGKNKAGLGDYSIQESETPIKIMDNVKTATICPGFPAKGDDAFHAIYAIRQDNSLTGFFDTHNTGIFPLGLIEGYSYSFANPPKVMESVQAVSSADLGSMYLKRDGSLWMTGYVPPHGTNTITTPIRVIVPGEVRNSDVSAAATAVYTGKALKPAVSVKYAGSRLDPGTDYTVTYSGNKNVGYGKVVVTAKNGYVGSYTRTFEIVPDKVKIKKAKTSKLSGGKTQIVLTISSKLKKPTYYEVYIYKNKKCTKVYKKFKVKPSQMKGKKIGAKGKLKKKSFYVRVRAVKKVGSKKHIGAWSKAKKIKGK